MTDFAGLALLVGCKATLILGLVAGLFALSGRRWPQNCLLWQRFGVTALLLLPLAVCALPTVGIPILSAMPPVAVTEGTTILRQRPTPLPPAAGGEPTSRADRSAELPAAGSADPAPSGFPATHSSLPGLALAAAYGLVVLALVIRFVRAWRGLAELKRASSLVSEPAWQATLEHWCTALKVDRSVELRGSDAVSVPMTFYWRSPVILIPGDCLATCDQSQRDAIVVHELTHVVQGDFFWQALTRLAAALYWLHPLMWLVRRQDRALCERICDACCLQHLSRESYALALVRIAGRKILGPAAALGIPMAHASSLKRRLDDLQRGATSGHSLLTRTQRVLFGGAAGLVLGSIVVGGLTGRTSAAGEQPEAVEIAEGRQAKESDLLLKLQATLYEKRVAVEVAEAKIAELEFKYTQKLFADKVVSQQELSLAEAKRDKAQAEAELGFAPVTAPTSDHLPAVVYEKKAAAAAAEAKIAELEFKYTQKLAADKVVSQNEALLAEARRDSAQAKAELAKAEWDLATGAAPTGYRLPAILKGQVLDQHDKPVAGASVIVSILRCDVHGLPTDAPVPEPWTVSTDDRGRYQFETGSPMLGPNDPMYIKVQAQGFPDVSRGFLYFHSTESPGTLPLQRLPTGRTVAGRLVDPQGNPVAEANVRFQASSDLDLLWDSGALPVDTRGMFSLFIPNDKATLSIYPRQFAPQIVKLPPDETDLGPIRVESGTSLIGRVVDREGRGVAGTVVGLQNKGLDHYLRLTIPLATAVKTDEDGSFRLPPVRGTYHVWVTDGAPDYSRQDFVTGAMPPPILPQRIDIRGEEETREIVLREAGSVTVRGTVRRADGSGVPDIEVRAETLPPGWESGTPLASTRTDKQGRYVLRLPAPAEGVIISVDQFVEALDHTFRRIVPVGQATNVRNLTFDKLTGDVKNADWVVGPKE